MGKQNAAIPQAKAAKSCRHSLFFHNEPYMIDENKKEYNKCRLYLIVKPMRQKREKY